MDPVTTQANFTEGPARQIPGDKPSDVKDALGICLSGGGYRAMLFHLGTLWRLNEFGLLPAISRISSVSGGSISAAALALGWKQLTFQDNRAANFREIVADPIYKLARRTIDAPAIIWGTLLPFVHVSDLLVRQYNKHLLHGASLQDLPEPGPGTPEFLFNSTSLQSLALWRFTRGAMRDWRVGEVPHPTLDLAVALAASSAFPPVLSPVRLKFKEGEIKDMPGTDLHKEPYTTRVFLTDGGVYDNLGLETVWKSHRKVLVSDAGGKMDPNPRPKPNWLSLTYDVLNMGDNQVRNLRKRQAVESFVSGERKGAYWSVRTNPAKLSYQGSIPVNQAIVDQLPKVDTRLKKLPEKTIGELVNWGYVLCDLSCQSFFASELPAGFPQAALPYPAFPI